MAYLALYRKWRPQTFEEVRGQDHIVTALRNQVRMDRAGHAYLFCGTRGTGKTSVAKIFAKAVNCEHPVDGSPCNECAMCKAIDAGRSINVVEIDAASNNGVDNIREIREEVAYSPSEGRYKVYIIDEVHMLSTGAFNALLKTLEEPPSYVIFILATTEVHKIPVTILSRCQRYDFRRILTQTISDRLRQLAGAEEISAESAALDYIARVADGSMRDALSLFDQCHAFYADQPLTYDRVLDVLGAVDMSVFGRLLIQVLDQDVTGVLETVQEVSRQGREMTQFAADFTMYLRNLLILKSSSEARNLVDASEEQLEEMMQEVTLTDADTLMRYIRVLSDLTNQMRGAMQKRVLLEVALIKLCKPAMEENLESVYDRLRILEDAIARGVAIGTPGQTVAAAEKRKAEEARKSPPAPKPKAVSEDVQMVIDGWRELAQDMSPLMRGCLEKAYPGEGRDAHLLITFNDSFCYHYFEDEQGKRCRILEDLIRERFGIDMKVDIEEAGASSYAGDDEGDPMAAFSGLDPDMIEEE